MSKVTPIVESIKLELEKGSLTPDEAVQKAQISFSETGLRPYKARSKEERLAKYESDMARSELAARKKVPMFSADTGLDLQPGFVLIGGVSGKGKSNVVANILAGYLKEIQRGTAIVLTNEEATDSVYNRTACVLQEVNFYDYRKGAYDRSTRAAIKSCVSEVADRVEVVFDEDWDMNCLEDVLSVLEYAVKSDAGLVVCDYLQNVNYSKMDQQMETYKVSKKLGMELKELGKRATMPIVMLAQLSPDSKDENKRKDIKERVENDKTIFNHAFQVIELIADFQRRETTFKVHKDRYGGTQGMEIVMEYRNGIYVFGGGI